MKVGGRDAVFRRSDPDGLSAAQRRLYDLLVSDAPVYEIADQIGKNLNTLKFYCARLYRKLGVNRRFELTARENLRLKERTIKLMTMTVTPAQVTKLKAEVKKLPHVKLHHDGNSGSFEAHGGRVEFSLTGDVLSMAMAHNPSGVSEQASDEILRADVKLILGE